MSDGAGTVPEEQLLVPGAVLDNKFSVVRCIGSGGMGAVYEIQHALTKHRRALKLLHPHYLRQPEAVDRFLREAAAAGTIDSEHIAETLDAGRLASGEPYLLMELLAGRSLAAWLEAGERMPLELALTVVSQACRGIHAAHEAGIIHRDLKPDNLFVTRRGDGVFVKILDFGVSKFADALTGGRTTRDGAFLGTLHYMAPEQFLNSKAVDRRADIYALGVILFECATGQHPYPLDTLAEVANKFMLEKIASASALCPGLPLEIDAIIERAVNKAPEDRYPDALAMAREIEALRGSKAVTLPLGSFWASSLERLDEARSLRVTDVASPSLLGELGDLPAATATDAAARSEGATAAAPEDSTRTRTAASDRAQALESAIDPGESFTPLTTRPPQRSQDGGARASAPRVAAAGLALVISLGLGALLLSRGSRESQSTRTAEPTTATVASDSTAASVPPLADPHPETNQVSTASAAASVANGPASASSSRAPFAPAPRPRASSTPVQLPVQPPAPPPRPPAPDHAGVAEFPQ